MQHRTYISNYGYTGTSPFRACSDFSSGRSGVGVVAGNVLTVFSDKKHTLSNTNRTTPYIVSTTDYDPFGMIMNGRNWNAGEYRFGFNGQEKTDEISGVGNHLDFKYRGYDPQTGRFWSVDPLFKDYPWNSTYCFAENNVIEGIDLEGLEYLSSKDAISKVVNGCIAWDKNNVGGGLIRDFSYGRSQIIFRFGLNRTTSQDIEYYSSLNQDRISDYALENSKTYKSPNEVTFNRPFKQGKSNWTSAPVTIKYGTSSSKLNWIGIISEGVVIGADLYAKASKTVDNSIYQDQSIFLSQAFIDFSKGVQNGYIPNEIFTSEVESSNVINYIFRGDVSHPTTFSIKDGNKWETISGDNYNNMIKDLGSNLYNGKYSGKFDLKKYYDKESNSKE